MRKHNQTVFSWDFGRTGTFTSARFVNGLECRCRGIVIQGDRYPSRYGHVEIKISSGDIYHVDRHCAAIAGLTEAVGRDATLFDEPWDDACIKLRFRLSSGETFCDAAIAVATAVFNRLKIGMEGERLLSGFDLKLITYVETGRNKWRAFSEYLARQHGLIT